MWLTGGCSRGLACAEAGAPSNRSCAAAIALCGWNSAKNDVQGTGKFGVPSEYRLSSMVDAFPWLGT